MRNFSLMIFCFMTFLLCIDNVQAQQDTLLLFTKPDCSNCQATKQQLLQSGINFIEKTLNESENAKIMLRKLSATGYKDKIYLPVMFLNNKLYHPAYQSDTGLVSLSLPTVIDSIKNKYRRGELHLATLKSTVQTTTSNQLQHDSDCEVKASPIYLICADFSIEDEAKEAMNKLINNGYSFAGIVYYKNLYRVYNKFFFDRILADSELIHTQETFKTSYLLELP